MLHCPFRVGCSRPVCPRPAIGSPAGGGPAGLCSAARTSGQHGPPARTGGAAPDSEGGAAEPLRQQPRLGRGASIGRPFRGCRMHACFDRQVVCLVHGWRMHVTCRWSRPAAARPAACEATPPAAPPRRTPGRPARRRSEMHQTGCLARDTRQPHTPGGQPAVHGGPITT